MKTALAKFGIVAMAAFSDVVWAQIPLAKPEFPPVSSNHPVLTPADYPVNGFTPNNDAANRKSWETNQICPLIEMQNVPITTVIEHLARQATINYLIDPALLQKWATVWEPTLSFKLTNATPKDVLERMLNVRGLALVEDPVSNIAYILPANRVTDPDLAGLEKTSASLHTNVIPLIQFMDVPITTAIEHLARQEGVNYLIAPEAAGVLGGSPEVDIPEPQLSIRLENINCWATLNRLLNIYDLAIVEIPGTAISRIVPRDEPLPYMDSSGLDSEIGSSNLTADVLIPLIQFSDLPLEAALEHLFQQCALRAELAPALKNSNDFPPLNIRWEKVTARQAIIVLCENYDLTVAKDEATGMLQVIPKETNKHHHLQLK